MLANVGYYYSTMQSHSFTSRRSDFIDETKEIGIMVNQDE